MREMRVRELYGYALIAGIHPHEARRLTPGFLVDMYVMRTKYDAKTAGLKMMSGFMR